jgi:hypothetical protein
VWIHINHLLLQLNDLEPHILGNIRSNLLKMILYFYLGHVTPSESVREVCIYCLWLVIKQYYNELLDRIQSQFPLDPIVIKKINKIYLEIYPHYSHNDLKTLKSYFSQPITLF